MTEKTRDSDTTEDKTLKKIRKTLVVLEVGLPPSRLTVRGATTRTIEKNEMKQSRRTQYRAIKKIVPSIH